MQIHTDPSDLPAFRNGVMTIGSFDGVHIGHQKIIKRLKDVANDINGETIVVTFDPHPRKIIYPKDNSLKLLTTKDEKIALLRHYGIDHLVIIPFTVEFGHQNPREYVSKFLIEKFNPAYIIIGYDHRFGQNRAGNVDLLKEYEKLGHFKVIEIPKFELEEIAISSTKIREALQNGNIDEATRFLNHPYTITGKVVRGKNIGTKIGFPTANIDIDDRDKLIPKDGIYSVICNIEGLKRGGMMYIGSRPTVDSSATRKLEVNIFDFNDDIYGKKITVTFVEWLRNDEKFDGLEALKKQLVIDKISAQRSLKKEGQKANFEKANVSIVILNYNGKEYLESFLPSVEYSSNYPFKIVVIDNASTDDSVDFLMDYYPEIKIIPLAQNHGFAEGYNRGMKYIDTPYAAILNSDVKVSKNWLDPLVEALSTHPETGIVQPKILSLENPEKFEYAGACGGFLDRLGYPFCRGRIFETVETDDGQYDHPIRCDWASGAAMVIKAELFSHLGGFDKDYFAHFEEIDFCWRVRRAGYEIKTIPASVVYHLGGGTLDYQSPQKVFLNFRNNLSTLIKNHPLGKSLWLIPLRLLLDGVAGIKFFAEGKWTFVTAIIRAHFSFYSRLGALWKTKKDMAYLISKYRIGNPVPEVFPKLSILEKYYLERKKTFDHILN